MVRAIVDAVGQLAADYGYCGRSDARAVTRWLVVTGSAARSITNAQTVLFAAARESFCIESFLASALVR